MSVDVHKYVEAKIGVWIKRQLYAANPRLGTCWKIVLRHMKPDGSVSADVHTYLLESDPAQLQPADLEIILGEIANAAIAHVNVLAGVQRYALFSYFSQIDTSPSCFPFLIQSENPAPYEPSSRMIPPEPTREYESYLILHHTQIGETCSPLYEVGHLLPGNRYFIEAIAGTYVEAQVHAFYVRLQWMLIRFPMWARKGPEWEHSIENLRRYAVKHLRLTPAREIAKHPALVTDLVTLFGRSKNKAIRKKLATIRKMSRRSGE
jgi:hypothetical protein